LRRDANGKLNEFGRAEIERDAYKKFVPEKYVARYVDFNMLITEGIPADWPKDSKGNNLTWYEDDWYLMEHPAFYEDIYLGLFKLEKRDFSKVPSRTVWPKYVQYLDLVEGKPRDDFRLKNRDLDAWGHKAFGWEPIEEKRRRAHLSPAEKRKQELKEIEELLK